MVKDLNDPTNRDTVPALLTPGEYVVNKEATQMFGPQIHAMNQAGLKARHADNIAHLNKGGLSAKISKLHGEGYTAPGQAYAIAKNMGYNQGGFVDFLKKHEGWRDKAYQDSGGVWTIGYGRTRNADGTPVKEGQTTTRKAEDNWIEDRASKELASINSYADKHGYDWNQGEKEALASFRYNGGQGMLDQLTANGTRDMDTIKKKFGLYNKAGGKKVDGLINRRNYEMELAGWGTVEQPEEGSLTNFNWGEAPAQEEEIDVSPQAEAQEQSMLGGVAEQAVQGMFQSPPPIVAPVMQSTSGNAPTYVPSVTEKKKVQTFNTGGWLSSLFQQDPKRKKALRRRPGFRNLDPFTSVPKGMVPPGTQGVAPVPNNPDIRPRTGFGQNLGNRMNFVPPPQDTPPIPGSDEAILQSSSQQVEGRETAALRKRHQEFDATMAGQEYDPRGNNQVPTPDWQMSPEGQSVKQPVQPRRDRTPSVGEAITGVKFGNTRGADAYLGNEPVNQQQPGLGNLPGEAPPQMDMAPPAPPKPQTPGGDPNAMGIYAGWDQVSPEEMLAEAQPKGVEGGGADPTAPSQMQGQPSKRLDKKGETPLGGGTTFTPDKRAKAEAVVTNTMNEEGAFKPEGGTAAVIKAGSEAAKQGKSEMASKAGQLLADTFGDLFNPNELKRMGIVMLGAMITGASPGQALAYAGQMYLNRVDTMAANKQKHEQELIKSGKYTPASIKAYQESGDPSQLVGVQAPRVGTGNFQEFYGPGGKRVNAEKVKVGDGQYVWVGENGQQITSKYHSDPSRAPGTREYTERVTKDSTQYTDMLKGLRGTFGTTQTREGNEYATDIVPEVGGREIARWAIENDVDPALMGELVQNSYQAAIADSDGKKVKSLTPYLNDLYVKATVGDASLFQTPSGKAMGADKINGLIGGLTKQAMAAGKFGNASEAVAKKQIIKHFQQQWNELDPGTQEQYNKQANKNESGFFVFLRKKTTG